MEELRLVSKRLELMDTDGPTSIGFYHAPSKIRNYHIQQIIKEYVNHYYIAKNQLQDWEYLHNEHQAARNARLCFVVTFIGLHFNEYCWPCHEVHFHTTFEEYVGCPYTTLTELVQFFKKI